MKTPESQETTRPKRRKRQVKPKQQDPPLQPKETKYSLLREFNTRFGSKLSYAAKPHSLTRALEVWKHFNRLYERQEIDEMFSHHSAFVNYAILRVKVNTEDNLITASFADDPDVPWASRIGIDHIMKPMGFSKSANGSFVKRGD